MDPTKKKNSKGRCQEGKRNSFNTSGWSLTENIRYKDFLVKNLHLFELPLRKRKELKVNIRMSKFMRTRNSSQCRSHHQKMLKYHGDNLAIIAHICKLESVL